MGSNTFGNIFKITTFGESHGKAIGVIVDGCPAGLKIDKEEIQNELNRRRPGLNKLTSPRKEPDLVQILSGVFEGRSTGAPIALLIDNIDAKSQHYEKNKKILRPGHANFTYLAKYGLFDHRGGGRSGGRETAVRVAAGAIAKMLIDPIKITAVVTEVGGVTDRGRFDDVLEKVMEEGDSVGAVISCTISGIGAGLGDPIYEKLEARLAYGMMSIPATKGVEFGEGFNSAKMKGSEHNDRFCVEDGNIGLESNNSGGTLAGISSGEAIEFRVAFKPTSSIKKAQKSVSVDGDPVVYDIPKGSRHDPCIALRAPAVIEAMAALVVADAHLMNRSAKADVEYVVLDEIKIT